MLAVLKERPGPGFALKQVRQPALPPGWVLVRVKAVGICGTDIPILDGVRPVPTPLIPGHEVSGVIAATGDCVNGLREGTPVAINMVVSCGECRFCRLGAEPLCERLQEVGIHIDGGFAEYVAVPARNAVPLPEGMTFEQGASADPVASAYRAVRMAAITPDDRVAVIGPGPIGLYALQLVKLWRPRQVIMLGTRPQRLEVARRLGADVLVDVNEANVAEAIRRATGGRMCSVVIEAVGHPDSLELAFAVGGRGARLVVAGVFHERVPVDPKTLVRSELIVRGSLCYSREEFAASLEMMAEGRIGIDSVVTHHWPLDEFDRALAAVKRREPIKVMLHPDG